MAPIRCKSPTSTRVSGVVLNFGGDGMNGIYWECPLVISYDYGKHPV